MEKIIQRRGIKSLYHFTRAENLPYIYEFGLIPRSSIIELGLPCTYNDDYRYDGCEDAICTSIEFPNYKLFYSLRKKNNCEWAVIRISADILLNLDCAFCSINAGDSRMYSQGIRNLKSKSDFEMMFDELPGGPTRGTLGIPDNYPTNPQAEVLIFDAIPTSYFESVYFDNREVLNYYKNDLPTMNGKINNKYFSYRCDWNFW